LTESGKVYTGVCIDTPWFLTNELDESTKVLISKVELMEKKLMKIKKSWVQKINKFRILKMK
jgi:hypothetical protein